MAKILVIDDDNLIRNGVIEMLRSDAQQQHTVLSAENGEDGLKLALAEKPDLIITDVRMPKKTGIELVGELRNDEWGQKLPIIVMTNDEATDTINEVLSSGASAFVSKIAIDRDSLIQQVNGLLGVSP